MKKKLVLSLLLTGLLTVGLTVTVLAGASVDYGTVPGTPPAGNVIWIAWLGDSMLPGGYPYQIMTEDSTNSSAGTDQGYAQFGSAPSWILFVRNFNSPAPISNSSTVTVLLGGLKSYSSGLWSSSYVWTSSQSSTNHGTAAVFNGTTPIPTITSIDISGNTQTVLWTGPAGKYHVYKSTVASGANNGASNGRYQYLKTVDAPSGAGSMEDVEAAKAWYIVIHATTAGAIDGCHSEEASPTAVELTDFSSGLQSSQPSVRLDWSTSSEINVIGFNVYRNEFPLGSRQKINAALIPASHFGESTRGLYSYVDADVQRFNSYEYWIEIVKTDRQPALVGPLQVMVNGYYFLPTIRN